MRCIIIIYLIYCFSLRAAPELTFPDACAKGEHFVIAAVGDILLHYPLQLRASKDGFESLWQEALPYLKAADIAYGNLEGPIAAGLNSSQKTVAEPLAWDFNIYSTYPLFNYHPSLAKALKASGFRIVSNANNHALDRGTIGINRTIEALDDAHVLHVGTAKRDQEIAGAQIVEANGFKIAWIACTEHTNGNGDKHAQIRYCYKARDRALILESIAQLKTRVDAIVVSPHFGDEYRPRPNKAQTAFAHEVLEAGATAVIGSHPHVLEPVETYKTSDGRTTLISYSLGNFVSHQSSTATRSTIMLFVGLTKNKSETIINGVRYVPMYMENNGAEKIHLRLLSADKHDDAVRRVIGAAIDEQRAIRSLPIVTNPECVAPVSDLLLLRPSLPQASVESFRPWYRK